MARVDSAGGVKQIVDYLRRSKARGNKLSIVRATVEKAPYPLL